MICNEIYVFRKGIYYWVWFLIFQARIVCCNIIRLNLKYILHMYSAFPILSLCRQHSLIIHLSTPHAPSSPSPLCVYGTGSEQRGEKLLSTELRDTWQSKVSPHSDSWMRVTPCSTNWIGGEAWAYIFVITFRKLICRKGRQWGSGEQQKVKYENRELDWERWMVSGNCLGRKQN